MTAVRFSARRLGLGVAAVAASGFAASLLTPRDGLANSTLLDVPDECRIDTFKMAADGKTPPDKLYTTNMLKKWGGSGRAFHASHDRKTIICYSFSGITVLRGTE